MGIKLEDDEYGPMIFWTVLCGPLLYGILPTVKIFLLVMLGFYLINAVIIWYQRKYPDTHGFHS